MLTTSVIELGGRSLTWSDYEAVVYDARPVAARPTGEVADRRGELERRLAAGELMYSVNTGYGADATRAISSEDLGRLQVNTIRAQALSIGPAAPEPVVRGTLLLQAQAYCQGAPAMRTEIIDALVAMLNDGRHPTMPLQPTLSASDLIPCAHIGLGLLGECSDSGIASPVRFAAKEGAGVTNNACFAAALAIDAVRGAERLLLTTEVVAAGTLEALGGHAEAFDAELIALRPHPGAIASAAHIRGLIADSGLLRAAKAPHDPFSLRCIPQVHGAIRDTLAHARAALEVELSSVTDNPVVLRDARGVFSGGNFHGEPIALPLDACAIAISELAQLSQRRTVQLLSGGSRSGLPTGLNPGARDSLGLSLAGSAAAALAARCASFSRPATVEAAIVDEMEDHVSMAAHAAAKAADAIEAARRVVALELLCAAQALDLRGTARGSRSARRLHGMVRARVPFAATDRPIDVEPLVTLLASGEVQG